MVRGRRPDKGERREVKAFRFASTELDAIERVAGERGEEVVEAIRSLPLVWAEREALVRAALEPHRGQFTEPEVKAILDVMNGVNLLIEPDGAHALGEHVAVEVSDGIDLNGLAKKWAIQKAPLVHRLATLPRAARVALELWCADLWRSSDDDELWTREIEWLSRGDDQ